MTVAVIDRHGDRARENGLLCLCSDASVPLLLNCGAAIRANGDHSELLDSRWKGASSHCTLQDTPPPT